MCAKNGIIQRWFSDLEDICPSFPLAETMKRPSGGEEMNDFSFLPQCAVFVCEIKVPNVFALSARTLANNLRRKG